MCCFFLNTEQLFRLFNSAKIPSLFFSNVKFSLTFQVSLHPVKAMGWVRVDLILQFFFCALSVRFYRFLKNPIIFDIQPLKVLGSHGFLWGEVSLLNAHNSQFVMLLVLLGYSSQRLQTWTIGQLMKIRNFFKRETFNF